MVVIADSSGLVALMKNDDSTHERAWAAARQLIHNDAEFIVPSEVFAETINILGKKLSNLAARRAAHELYKTGFSIVGSDQGLLLEAADRLETHKSSTSFVDSLVMAWADRNDTRIIFGFDVVFGQQGYELPD